MARTEREKNLDLILDKRELRKASIRLFKGGIIKKEAHWDNLEFIDNDYNGDIK